MALKRLGELIAELEQASSSYANQATLLSKTITAFEKHLNMILAGKSEVRVTEHDEGSFEVRYGRSNSPAGWYLFVRDKSVSSQSYFLHAASIEMKIRALPMFEPLLTEMVRRQQVQSKEIVDALGSIEPLIEQLHITNVAKGGANDE